jgi:hypothetical protein
MLFYFIYTILSVAQRNISSTILSSVDGRGERVTRRESEERNIGLERVITRVK